ncbi:hypothetical protein [Pseudoalteromonas sp. S558]|uniref:hypothetical protein n=1 Tax=Pseudoalteromonas sp. S558 TaxID=2066515 RepID=UPI00110C0FF9|nr:hypothetical protein [Pseudoalteromonas sp. S558]TMO00097.1 hypothetical protein CWB66_15520 [Pseudoalteromonas sp. S558]
MEWFDTDSLFDSVGNIWDAATDYVGEQYDSYQEYQKTVASESQKDVAKLRDNEPLKGATITGAPATTGTTGAVTQHGAPVMSNQLIAGVDNKMLAVGAVVVLLFVFKR